eukprot:309270_1
MSHNQNRQKRKRRGKRGQKNKNKNETNNDEDQFTQLQLLQEAKIEHMIQENAKIEINPAKVENDDQKNDDKAKFRQAEMVLLQQINVLQNNNLELKKEVTTLKQQLAQQEESKNDRCYIRNEVLQYNSIDKNNVTIGTEIKQKQEEIDKAFDSHADRLTKWNDFSIQLENRFKNKSKLSQDVDEKKQDDKQHHDDIVQLLNSYTNCMKLLYKQQLRTEEITGYAKSLSTTKKKLRKIVQEYTDKEEPGQQKYTQLCSNYTNLKKQRESKQLQIIKLISEINDITKQENETNKQKCEMLDNLNISIVEKEKYDQLLTKCKSLTIQYMEFQGNVDNKSDELQKYYSEKWDAHEKLWPKWNVTDIICWIKYLIHDKKVQLSKGVNLAEIEKKMSIRKVKGKQLEDTEKKDLELFGFVIFDDMNQLWKRIRELVEKYPDTVDVSNDFVEGQVLVTRKIQIPEEYICPISGKIMIDPVQYEEITYDRNNFLQHVQKCGTVPGTDQKYDKTEPLFKNSRLKQKINAFLVSNPQFVNEGV